MSGYEDKSQEPSVYGECGSDDGGSGLVWPPALPGSACRGARVDATDTLFTDYATTRSGRPESYASFAPPSFDPHFSSARPAEPHALPASHQMPFLDPPFEPRDRAYQPGPNPLIPARSRPPPQLPSGGLFRGHVGDQFRIDHSSRRDFDLHRTHFTLIFGNTYCKAAVTDTRPQHGGLFLYTLTVDVPPRDSSGGEASNTMPLLLDITDDHGTKLELQNYGAFEYLSPVSATFPPFSQVPGAIMSRKRKIAQESMNYPQPLSKRAASQPIQPRYSSSEMSPGLQPSLMSPSPYFDPNLRYALPSGNYEGQQRLYPSYPQTPTYPYATSPGLQHSKLRSPTHASFAALRQNIGPRVTRTPRVASARVSSNQTNPVQPTLIRTSILQQSSATPSAARSFNPYANYPDGKAELALAGNLMSMIENWRPEEREAHRRLVEFSRSQSGSIVTASFKAVLPEERTPNSACISCIWWEEKDSYYVTSVDTISLLESLIAARFTVEEKNRIRRNLEALKPDTISKIKDNTDSFFRLIMSFPKPKPRNIEKDVKVFVWSDLEKALGKIFGKYVCVLPFPARNFLCPSILGREANFFAQSASFSSTASHMLPAASSMAEALAEQRPTASPRSATGSTVSMSHQSSMTSTALSPNVTGSAGHAQHGVAQGDPLVVTSLPMVTSAADEYRSAMLGMGPLLPGQAYGPYGMSQFAPTSPYHHSMGMSGGGRPQYLPGYMAGPASPAGYGRPLQYFSGEQASEGAGASDDRRSYSPYQPTTSG